MSIQPHTSQKDYKFAISFHQRSVINNSKLTNETPR